MMIVGADGDTPESLKETFKWINKNDIVLVSDTNKLDRRKNMNSLHKIKLLEMIYENRWLVGYRHNLTTIFNMVLKLSIEDAKLYSQEYVKILKRSKKVSPT